MQNSKDVLNVEQTNPIDIVKMKSGAINETRFLEGFNNMFSWNWKWRCKGHDKDAYLMKFHNKSRLVELSKFGYFNLFRTRGVINMKSWTFDNQAIGKLRTVWVKIGKVPECFRDFFWNV